jgi:hypothetical protein
VLLQLPQWFESLLKSVQVPLHSPLVPPSPPPHAAVLHVPLWQTPLGQALPQAPQCEGLFLMSTQTPPQHESLWHCWLFEHAPPLRRCARHTGCAPLVSQKWPTEQPLLGVQVVAQPSLMHPNGAHTSPRPSLPSGSG